MFPRTIDVLRCTLDAQFDVTLLSVLRTIWYGASKQINRVGWGNE